MRDVYTSTYVVEKTTPRMVKLVDQDPPDGKILNSPFPWPYITKELYKEMGSPGVVRITINPMLPTLEVDTT